MTWCHCTGSVQSGTGERNGEKVTLEAWPEDTYHRCRSDVIRRTVPVYKQKGLVADGRWSFAADDQQ